MYTLEKLLIRMKASILSAMEAFLMYILCAEFIVLYGSETLISIKSTVEYQCLTSSIVIQIGLFVWTADCFDLIFQFLMLGLPPDY